MEVGGGKGRGRWGEGGRTVTPPGAPALSQNVLVQRFVGLL